MKFRMHAKRKLQEITHNSVWVVGRDSARMRVKTPPSQPRIYLRSGGIFFTNKAHLLLLNDDYYYYLSATRLIHKYFNFIIVCFADIEIFLEK